MAIGICDRCQMKRPLVKLHKDPNFPGLQVCKGCTDLFDPYRLPARKPDDITLKRPRPDQPIVLSEGDDTGDWYPPVGDP